MKKLSTGKKVVFYLLSLLLVIAVAEGLSRLAWEIIIQRAAKEMHGKDISKTIKDDPNLGVLIEKQICHKMDVGRFDYYDVYNDDVPPWTLCGNRLGFRGDNFSIKKPSDTYRVVCMGDSSTMGDGVEENQTYCFRLKEHLEKLGCIKGLEIETINAGIWGHSSYQGVISYLKFVKYWDADFVTISYGANDQASLKMTAHIKRDKFLYKLPDKGVVDSYHAVPNFGLAKAWYLITMLFRENLKENKKLDKKKFSTIAKPVGKGGKDEENRDTVDEYREDLKFLIDNFKRDGAGVLLLSIAVNNPEYFAVISNISSQNKLPFLNANAIFDREIVEIMAGRKYAEKKKIIDSWLKPDAKFPSDHSSRYVTIDGIHPNIIGHEILAKELATKICDEVNKYK